MQDSMKQLLAQGFEDMADVSLASSASPSGTVGLWDSGVAFA